MGDTTTVDNSSETEDYVFKASVLEIVIPPFVFGLLLIVIVLIAAVKKRMDCARLCQNTNIQLNSDTLISTREISAFENIKKKPWKSELKVLHSFICYPSNCKALIRLVLPTLLLLVFCPLTIWLMPMAEDFFWPPEHMAEMPKVDDVIAAFLTPASLVYALGFGYALQAALNRMDTVSKLIEHQLALLRQCSKLAQFCDAFTSKGKKSAYIDLKNITLNWMHQVIDDKDTVSEIDKPFNELYTLYQNCMRKPCNKEDRMLDRFFETVWQLEDVIRDSRNQGRRAINLMLWTFLELEACITFFGILLLRADSYRLELTLCILTVVTISAFTYILADLDSPYHGAFAIQLTGFTAFIIELNDLVLLQEPTKL